MNSGTSGTGTQTIAVLGGTGKTGRRVVTHVREQGHRVRAAARRGATRFDWEDEATWPAVTEGADAVYVVPHEAPGGNDRLAAFARRAVDAGVRRLVLLSAREWVETGLEEGVAREEIVRAAGTGWTILRPVWFAQNFSEEPFLARGIAEGEVVYGTGEGRHPFVDAEDIAAVAAAALTDDRHDGQHYELTGPRALTVPEAVREIAAALGRPIATRALDREAYRRHLAERYYPDGVADGVIDLCDLIRSGNDAHLSDGIHRALSRQPRDFTTYAAATATSGDWR